MAKASMIARERKREKTVIRYSKKRAELKAAWDAIQKVEEEEKTLQEEEERMKAAVRYLPLRSYPKRVTTDRRRCSLLALTFPSPPLALPPFLPSVTSTAVAGAAA